MANYNAVTNQAQQVAATPYQPYTGELVAGVNGQQNTGINAVNSASGIQDPYNSSATGLANSSAGAIDPTQYSAQQLQQYESPYQNDVINSTMAQINNQNQQQASSLTGNAISSGAFGGDRAGVAQAALAGQQDIASNATLANLNNQNFQNAQSEFNNQQTTNLGAQQNNASRQLAASQQLGTLGSTAQTEALNEAGAQTAAGTLQQTTQQAQDTANYNQYLQQLAYPFQTTGWLANIVEGIGSQSGGTSNGQTQTQSGNTASTVAGGLLGLGSFLARGGRVPHMAGGGGLGGGDMTSGLFNPTALGAVPGLGGGSIVPAGPLQVGHTMPTGTTMGGGAAAQTPQQMGANIASTAKGVQGLANGVGGLFGSNSSGDYSQLGAGIDGLNNGLDMSDIGLARGGRAGRAFADGGLVLGDAGLMQRPHFDDGGAATANQLLFDPGALGADPQPVDNSPPNSGLVAPPAAPADVAPPAGKDAAPALPAPVDVASLPVTDVGATGVVPAAAVAPPSGGLAAAQPAAAPAGGATLPRGLRNNNPGNLVDNAWTQGLPGYAGSDGRFAVFETPGAGAAAMDKNLQSYAAKGIQTPLQLSSKWAPAGDGGNNPTAYAGIIAKAVGVGINDPIDLNDPGVRQQVASAITQVENGTGAHAGAGLGASASAYDSTHGLAGSSGVAAIDSATHGQTGTDSGSPRSGLLGLNLSDSTRQAMLSAGLGIMGGGSLNAFQNIGQGGLNGLKMGMEAGRNQADIGLKQAQTRGAQTENQMKQKQLDMMMNALGENPKGSPAAGSTSAPSIAPSASSVAPSRTATQPGGVQPSAQPAANVQLDPRFDPKALRERALQLSAGGPMLAPMAKQYGDLASQIETQGYSYDTAGRRVPLPGFNDVKAGTAASTARAEGQVKNELAPAMSPSGVSYLGGQAPQGGGGAAPGATIGGTPPAAQMDPKTAAIRTSIPAAPAGGGYPVPDVPRGAKVTGIGEGAKELAKADMQFSDMVGKAPVLDQGISRFQSLAQAFKLFQSGSSTERLQAGAAIAQSYGYNDLAKRILGGDPAAVQWVGKEGVQLTLDTLKAANPRFAQSEFNQLANKGTPNPEMLPQANHELIAEGLGLMQRNKAFIQDWQTAQQQGWQSPSAFYTQWSNANPMGAFVKSAQKQIGNFKGMDLPPPTEWTEGATYVAPKSMSAQQSAAFAKRGIQPGSLFKFNGRDSANPLQAIPASAGFSSQLSGG